MSQSPTAWARDRELAALVIAGATLTEVAQELGVTPERIRQRLERAGLEGVRRYRRPAIDPITAIRALERRGGNQAAAARDLGCSADSLRRIAAATGLRATSQEALRLPAEVRRLRERLVVWVLRDLAEDGRVRLVDLGAALWPGKGSTEVLVKLRSYVYGSSSRVSYRQAHHTLWARAGVPLARASRKTGGR